MRVERKLPLREQVFIASLAYHGFRVARRHDRLKFNRSYVIPSTKQEDANLIDFWIKPAWSFAFIPVQVTQRGTAIIRQRNPLIAEERFRDFSEESERRVRRKRRVCKRCRIAFAMIRDYTGLKPSKSVAWGDRKALQKALQALGDYTNARVSIC